MCGGTKTPKPLKVKEPVTPPIMGANPKSTELKRNKRGKSSLTKSRIPTSTEGLQISSKKNSGEKPKNSGEKSKVFGLWLSNLVKNRVRK